MGDVLNFERTDSFSVFAWIKNTVLDECCGQRIVTKQSNVERDIPGSFMLHISLPGGLGNQLAQDQFRDLFEITDPSFQSINDTQWHLVGVTYDGSSTLAGHNLYIDGQIPPVLDSGNDLTGSILTTADLQISGRDGPNFVWNGLIDEAVIFDRELSGSEALAMYNAGSAGMCKEVYLVQSLIEDVLQLNITKGISSSLDNKLEVALHTLDDMNENNDIAAINTLYLFIDIVNAQSGNQIPVEDANALVAAAEDILSFLNESW